MGKVKRKQRVVPSTFNSPLSAVLSPSNNKNIISCLSEASPPKSVSPCSSRSSTSPLSSCSSSTSSLSSPPSTTSSPSPSWPLSLTQSQLPNSVSSYIIDEDSGLGGSDLSTVYSPHKVARFNQAANTSSSHISPLTAHAHNDMLNLKAPFSKRSSPNAISPTGVAHHHTHNHLHRHHSQFLPPVQVPGYPPEVSVVSTSSVSPPQCYPNAIPNGTVTSLRQRNSSPNQRNNLLVPTMRKSSTTSSSGNCQNVQNNCNVNNKNSPSSYSPRSKNGKYELKILSQPEEQHRARYLTEGSRGAIKDKSGHGYPVVKLCGYSRQPIKIQCFIGHDKYIGTPHLFYQASKIAGKNSTSCYLKKVDGTSMITMEASPANNMEINVDCIGILKERNVDVEQKLNKFQRFGHPNEAENQTVANIKRSTRCRLVFRAELPETGEILQAVSAPILCTQPLGTPEINKKSLTQCDINGGTELFIIGKNFLKDAKVIFRNEKWIKIVEPNREYLKSTHLICVIPGYDVPMQTHQAPSPQQKANHRHRNGKSSAAAIAAATGHPQQQQVIEVNLMVKSGGKCSDPHKFYYTIGGPSPVVDNISRVNTSDPNESVSSYDHHDSSSLIETGKHPKDATSYVAQYHHQQQQLENEALARTVEGQVQSSHQQSTNSGIDLIDQNQSQQMSAMSPINSALVSLSPEVHDSGTSSNSVVCEPSVLAAAAVAAASEVQALSDSNQLTAANLHQTVTTAAAVAVAATENIINVNEQNNSSPPGTDPATTLTPIPGPPNQAAVAVVAAQTSDTATALSVAAAVKQESLNESDLVGVPVSQPVGQQVHQSMQSIQSATVSMTQQTGYMSNALMANPNAVSACNPEVTENKAYLPNYSSNLVTSTNASTVIENNSPSIQSMLCHQDMALLKQSEMVNQQAQLNAVLNSGQVLNTYNPNESVLVGNSNALPPLVRITSMETNPMSFANLTAHHASAIDPMTTLKVDTLTINDKVPLPQLSLSDINNQLSMPSTATDQTNMNMIPMNTVMSEKPVLYTAADVASMNASNQMQPVDAVAMVNGSLVSMVNPDKSTNIASLSSAVGPMMEPSPATAGPSVIMGPTSYNIAPPESKCSNGMIGANYGSIKSNQLVNLPQNDYMNPNGLVPDLKSALASTMMGQMAQAQVTPQQQQVQQAAASALAQQDKVNANIESFIQNMANENLSTQPTDLSVNSMMTSSITTPSQPMPTYLNTSLIADCRVSSGQMMNSSMLSHQSPSQQQQNATGVIISGQSVVVSVNNAVMMDTLPPAVNTQSQVMLTRTHLSESTHTVCTPTTVINTLGHSLESVSLPGQVGPIQFTDNVEMALAPNMSGANTVSVNAQPLPPQAGLTLAGPAHQYLSTQSMITSDQSNATTGNTVIDVKGAPNNQATVSTAPMASSTVLANHQLVHQQQSSNIHTMSSMSTMSDAELLNFINPATFE